VELDHRVLAGAQPDLDADAWARVLKDSGVTRVPLAEPPPGVAGRAVEDAREARRLSDALDATALVERTVAELALPAAPFLVIAVVALVVGFPVIGATVLAGAFVLHRVAGRRREDEDRGRTADHLRQRRELHTRVRALAGRTFVALLGEDTLVINTPHLTFLEARIHDVDRSWGRMLDRDRALARLREEMVVSNRTLGRDELDAEVQAIDDERDRIRVSEPAFKVLRDELEVRLHKAQETVEYLAEVGRRQALSRQLGGVLEHAAGDTLADLAASLEVDIAGVEAELQRLDVSLSDADASLRALLEVEAVTWR
jgi:hypothetical protein